MQEALQRIAALTACHAAVKANDPLTYEKMTHILDELRGHVGIPRSVRTAVR